MVAGASRRERRDICASVITAEYRKRDNGFVGKTMCGCVIRVGSSGGRMDMQGRGRYGIDRRLNARRGKPSISTSSVNNNSIIQLQVLQQWVTMACLDLVVEVPQGRRLIIIMLNIILHTSNNSITTINTQMVPTHITCSNSRWNTTTAHAKRLRPLEQDAMLCRPTFSTGRNSSSARSVFPRCI